MKERYVSKASAIKYVLSDLGWTQTNAKYDNKDYQRSIWLKSGYSLKGGVMQHSDGWFLRTHEQLISFSVDDHGELVGYYSRNNKEGEGPEPEIDVEY